MSSINFDILLSDTNLHPANFNKYIFQEFVYSNPDLNFLNYSKIPEILINVYKKIFSEIIVKQGESTTDLKKEIQKNLDKFILFIAKCVYIHKSLECVLRRYFLIFSYPLIESEGCNYTVQFGRYYSQYDDFLKFYELINLEVGSLYNPDKSLKLPGNLTELLLSFSPPESISMPDYNLEGELFDRLETIYLI